MATHCPGKGQEKTSGSWNSHQDSPCSWNRCPPGCPRCGLSPACARQRHAHTELLPSPALAPSRAPASPAMPRCLSRAPTAFHALAAALHLHVAVGTHPQLLVPKTIASLKTSCWSPKPLQTSPAQQSPESFSAQGAQCCYTGDSRLRGIVPW